MKKRRGSLYLMVLLLTGLLVVLGMAYLGMQGAEAQASLEAVSAAQAYQLARAGIEDAFCKLSKDKIFPPPGGLEQKTYTYGEQLSDSGSYRVTVDTSRIDPPQSLIGITSQGFAGASRAEVSCWVNSETMKVVRWDE